ncbi:hypothetical protein AB0M20_26220 [Actinoplanes sp. NPDC051633]|uniref:hypothetical protein n=1 Tax=Actinoplanes sp. NPDC051633 TaxID=3155670 RepID=UPI003446E8AA
MSDRLDSVLDTAAPLLKRVDEVLSASGAPPDHEVWPTLRRVRLLPWDAVNAVAALRPAALAEAAPELRADAQACAAAAESLPPPGEWSGTAADAYDDLRKRTAVHLTGTADSLDVRLTATADLADALTSWMSEARAGLAATLAEILTSTEALALSPQAAPSAPSAHSAPGAVDPASEPEARAAADVAARVLQSVADTYDAAAGLMSTTADLTNVRWS